MHAPHPLGSVCAIELIIAFGPFIAIEIISLNDGTVAKRLDQGIRANITGAY